MDLDVYLLNALVPSKNKQLHMLEKVFVVTGVNFNIEFLKAWSTLLTVVV
jgi:hypothetical protein